MTQSGVSERKLQYLTGS